MFYAISHKIFYKVFNKKIIKQKSKNIFYYSAFITEFILSYILRCYMLTVMKNKEFKEYDLFLPKRILHRISLASAGSECYFRQIWWHMQFFRIFIVICFIVTKVLQYSSQKWVYYAPYKEKIPLYCSECDFNHNLLIKYIYISNKVKIIHTGEKPCQCNQYERPFTCSECGFIITCCHLLIGYLLSNESPCSV